LYERFQILYLKVIILSYEHEICGVLLRTSKAGVNNLKVFFDEIAGEE